MVRLIYYTAVVWLAGAPPLPSVPVLPHAPDPLSSLRYYGMCRYVKAAPADLVQELGHDTAPPGQGIFEDVYQRWYHKLGRTRSEWSREQFFYRALCGVALMHQELLYSTSSGLVSPDIVELARRLRVAVKVPSELNSALKNGNIDLDGFQSVLLRTDRAVQQAYLLDKAFWAIKGITALAEDGERLLAGPLVASQEVVAVMRAIKASTDDKDLSAACDRLIREIHTGQVDYLYRLSELARDGKLAEVVASALGKYSLKAATQYLLTQLGFEAAVASGVAMTISGSIFAAVASLELGFWLCGETAAFEHARLAHFADYIRPGLAAYWREQLSRLSLTWPSACAEFDATTRALLLLHAYVQFETAKIIEAYRNAAIPASSIAGLIPPSLSPVRKAYREWDDGTTFAPWIWGPESPSRAWIYRWPKAKGPGIPPIGVPGLPRPEAVARTATDLVFCIDATGSMKDDIDAVKSDCIAFVDELESVCPDLRLGLVTYRDFEADGPNHLDLVVPLTSDNNRVVEAIESIVAEGGGDDPEDVLDGLEKALTMDWRTGVVKLVILMGDAPPKEPDYAGRTVRDIAKLAWEVDPAHIYAVVPTTGTVAEGTYERFEKLSQGTGGEVFTVENSAQLLEAIKEAIAKAINIHTGDAAGGSIGASCRSSGLSPVLIGIGLLILINIALAVALVANYGKSAKKKRSPVHWYIELWEPDGTRRVFSGSAYVITVGRAASNTVRCSDPQVSRFHLRIQLTPKGWRIVDLGSSNGTWINGQRVSRAVLHSGAMLQIGRTRMRFSVLNTQS